MGGRLTSENQYVSSMSEYETDASGLLRIVQATWAVGRRTRTKSSKCCVERGGTALRVDIAAGKAGDATERLEWPVGSNRRAIDQCQSALSTSCSGGPRPQPGIVHALDDAVRCPHRRRRPNHGGRLRGAVVRSVQIVEGSSLDALWRDAPDSHGLLLAVAMRAKSSAPWASRISTFRPIEWRLGG